MSNPETMLPKEQQGPPAPQDFDGSKTMPEHPQNPIADTNTTANPQTIASKPQLKTPFYYKSWFIALSVLIFWPVGLALMWSKGCSWKRQQKIIVTILCLALVAANIYSIYKAVNEASTSSINQPTASYSEPLESEAAQESVDRTTELLSSNDKSAYVATPLLTSPNKNELLSYFSDFEPQVIEGRGNQTIDLSSYAEPVLLSVDYGGEDLMSVWAGDSTNANSFLLVNTIGTFHGTTTTLLAPEAPTQLSIEESGNSPWTLTISPLNRMPYAEPNKTYYQSQVLLVAPEDQNTMNKFIFSMHSNDATNSFEAYAMNKDLGNELALASGMNYTGEAEWKDLPCILMVMTGGEWNFEIS